MPTTTCDQATPLIWTVGSASAVTELLERAMIGAYAASADVAVASGTRMLPTATAAAVARRVSADSRVRAVRVVRTEFSRARGQRKTSTKEEEADPGGDVVNPDRGEKQRLRQF